MAGCTDLAYRRVARRFGCELAFCEMVRDLAVVRRNETTMELLRTADWDHPVGMQLLGRDPETLAEAARILESLGADVIDLNLGCPVNKIVKTACGSALLKEPDQVARILERLVPAVRVPVTIKIRTGYDDGDDDRFLQIARRAGEAGVGAITAHGRTRRQGFSGMANHEAIRRVKEVSSCPVVGNGNIRCGADAERMFRETGCDAVMVARGALGNPWIYREIASHLDAGTAAPAPTPAERASVLAEHYALIRELYGDEIGTRRVRKVVPWYVKGAPHAAELRDRAGRLATPAEVDGFIAEFAALPAAALAPGQWGWEGAMTEE